MKLYHKIMTYDKKIVLQGSPGLLLLCHLFNADRVESQSKVIKDLRLLALDETSDGCIGAWFGQILRSKLGARGAQRMYTYLDLYDKVRRAVMMDAMT